MRTEPATEERPTCVEGERHINEDEEVEVEEMIAPPRTN